MHTKLIASRNLWVEVVYADPRRLMFRLVDKSAMTRRGEACVLKREARVLTFFVSNLQQRRHFLNEDFSPEPQRLYPSLVSLALPALTTYIVLNALHAAVYLRPDGEQRLSPHSPR